MKDQHVRKQEVCSLGANQGYFCGLCTIFKPSPVPPPQNKGTKPSIQAEREAKQAKLG